MQKPHAPSEEVHGEVLERQGLSGAFVVERAQQFAGPQEFVLVQECEWPELVVIRRPRQAFWRQGEAGGPVGEAHSKARWNGAKSLKRDHPPNEDSS
jgi:hypothetical protein